MTQADSVHSTPRLNTPVAPTRRRFLSTAAGVAAGGAALALATVPPRPANAATASPLGPADASPALLAAARALDDADERLKQVKAAFKAVDAKADEWRELNPRPITGKRALKRWHRRITDYLDSIEEVTWEDNAAAEKDFRAAQVAVAEIDARDMRELAVKACLSGVYDRVSLSGHQSAVIGFSVALNLLSLTNPVQS